MTIDTNAMISITEANQNFSCNENFSYKEKEKIANSQDVLAVSERLIKQNMEAYEVLAK